MPSGVVLELDVTTAPGVETLTVAIETYVPAADSWVALTAFSAVSGTGTFTFIMAPRAIETAAIANQQVAGIPLPLGKWRSTVTHSGSGTWIYSLSSHGAGE